MNGRNGEAGQGIALLCDRDGRVLRVVRDTLGLGASIAPGQPLAALADAAAAPKAEAFMGALARDDAAFDWEINVALPDGRLRPLHFAAVASPEGWLVAAAVDRAGVEDVHAELMQIHNEGVNALRGVHKDLRLALRDASRRDDAVYEELSRVNNELATLQRDLAKSNAALAQANADKSRLLSMAAHDLRAPLGVILDYSGFLQDEAAPKLDTEQCGFVATIRETSAAMLRLIDDLLDTDAIESGRLSLAPQRLDIGPLLARAVAAARRLAARKGIEVLAEPAEALPPVHADPGRIGQVLDNLLSNAIKYSGPDTRVRVVATLADEGTGLRVAVHDQGQGIAAAELDRLFRPYGRTSARATGGERSHGLGLAIVRKIVEGHHGRVEVASEPGRGSVFGFVLPLQPPLPDHGR